MKNWIHSFRARILISFLICSLVPLLLCSVLLVQIIDIRLNRKNREVLSAQMDAVMESADTVSKGLQNSAAVLSADEDIQKLMAGRYVPVTRVNASLYRATEKLRGYGCACLYDEEGKLLYSTGNQVAYPALSPDWGILRSSRQAAGEPVFMVPTQYDRTGSILLQGAVQLRSQPEGEPFYLVLEMDQEDFFTLFSGRHGLSSGLIIVNRFWQPVYASTAELWSQTAPALRSQLMAGQPLSHNDQFFEVQQHSPTGLYMILQEPMTFSRDTIRMMYLISLSCALFCVVVAILIYLPLSRQISEPVRQLRLAFQKLEEDDLEVQLPTDRKDELSQLAKTFNLTVRALRQNRQDRIDSQRELNEAQIRLLQTQLNPHFLCNTLDTMKWISKIHKVPEVAEMSANLADILRYCITSEEFVPLYRETEFLERYISIQKIRMGDKFDFQVDLPEELADCIVPKMILQPLVENAVIHGLQETKDSLITVTVRSIGTMLEIRVTDNGCGLPPELVGKPYERPPHSEGHHLGLYNVNTILSKNYGSGSGLYLDRGPGGIGTSVTATLPMEGGPHD